jgi:hypothetical protein
MTGATKPTEMTKNNENTAMTMMLDELMAHEYTIPLELIVKCKELIETEKKQHFKTFEDSIWNMDFNEYYNGVYGGTTE